MKNLLLLLFITLSIFTTNACTGGSVDEGTITPTTVYQTIDMNDGDYVTLSVTCGNTYNFDFCGNGGTSGNLYPEISVLDVTGTTEYAFAPYAGGCSILSWTSNFTGTIRVLITDDGCGQGGAFNDTMAYNVVVPAVIDPSFTMSVVCGGGNSTVTGTNGGTFTFNPLPSDGAQIDASTGLVSNGTVGTSYTIEYTICGNSSTQSITVLDDNCWTLNGDAQYINVMGENCIELTSSNNNQIGCSWNGQQLDFNSDFSLTLDYYFGSNVNGADGSTFTFHPGASTACGQNGGQLGAGNIPNSLVIEFDTYDNDNPAHIYDMTCDHIAVEIDGDLQNSAPAAGPVCAKTSGGNIDDGTTYTVEVQWNATSNTLEIYFDGALRLSYTNDIVNNVFGGQNMVYWGATAATGGLNNQQYFCPNTLVILPTEIEEFTVKCDGVEEKIEWKTTSENRLDHFVVEYTIDNIAFFPIETINAFGNSTVENSYSTQFKLEDKQQRYYRLKSVDENGGFKYTGIIASEQCLNNDVIQYVYNNTNQLTIVTNGGANIQILNQLGQTIVNQNTKNKFITIPTYSLTKGFYFILAEDDNGNRSTRKVYINKD